MEDPIRLKELLDDLRAKARAWPPDKFLAHVDSLVESSRRHIESSDDEREREGLLMFYQGIIQYAFACQFQALGPKAPGHRQQGISASC